MREYLSNKDYLTHRSKRENFAQQDKIRAERRHAKNIAESILTDTALTAPKDNALAIDEFMTANQGNTEKVQYITSKKKEKPS
jgi:hypothetical protein